MMDIFGAWKWWIIGVAVAVLLVATNLWSYKHGMEFKDGQWEKARAEALVAAIKQRNDYNTIVDATLDKYHKASKGAQARKDKRDADIPSVTDGRVCFSSWDSVRLFNDALSDKPGTVLDTGGVVDGPGAPAITDVDIQRINNENGSRWRECREKIGIIKENQDARRRLIKE